MASASHESQNQEPSLRFSRIGTFLGLALAASCAQVLGVPSDPEVVPPPSPRSTAADLERDLPRDAGLSDAGVTPTSPAAPGERVDPTRDGVVPPGNVAGIDAVPPTPALEPAPPPAEIADTGADAGPSDAGLALPPDSAAAGCEGDFERVPVDVVILFDNSGSMSEESAAFEGALPGFVADLEENGVDQRIILLSRHRSGLRSSSEEASTSVCVAAPVSGLDACPAEAPVPSARFFQFSIKLDANDSFERAIEALTSPDPFGLTDVGWSEWLRPGARRVLVEISDADSALGIDAFLAGLNAGAPEHFGTTTDSAGFSFHSIVGVAQKRLVLDVYGPDEALEPAVCSGAGSAPNDAGLVYQTLSRATRGLRQSICPVDALGLRLGVVAVDVIRRSVVECP